MKDSWLLMSSKFNALNKRERWMVCGALLVVTYTIINSLLLGPLLNRQKLLNGDISADQAQIQDLTTQLNAFSHQNVTDPDALNKQHIAALQARLQTLDTQLNGLKTTLISPDKMPELLRSLLKKNGKLKLVELKTLAPKSLLEALPESLNTATDAMQKTPSVANAQTDAAVFKHGVEITVEGRYLDLLEYVTELEQMPWHVLWSKAALSTDQHPPLSQLTLTVYTLSLDKTWLSI